MNHEEQVLTYLNCFDQILNQMEYRMLSFQSSQNITVDFLQTMIPHHEAAIFMCYNLLQYTKNKKLKNIAQTIITTQTRGIEQMKYILKTTPTFHNHSRDVEKYLSTYFQITREMIYKMRNSLRTPDINLNFISEMIPHHEGAIAMCRNLLQYFIDPRLEIVAKSIIKEQSQGVKELEEVKRTIIARNKD